MPCGMCARHRGRPTARCIYQTLKADFRSIPSPFFFKYLCCVCVWCDRLKIDFAERRTHLFDLFRSRLHRENTKCALRKHSYRPNYVHRYFPRTEPPAIFCRERLPSSLELMETRPLFPLYSSSRASVCDGRGRDGKDRSRRRRSRSRSGSRDRRR